MSTYIAVHKIYYSGVGGEIILFHKFIKSILDIVQLLEDLRVHRECVFS